MPRGIRQAPEPPACRSLRLRGHVVLTPLALAVLAAVARLTRERGFPPNLKELAAAVGTPNWHVLAAPLAKLRRLGLVGAVDGPRSLVVTCRWLPERPASPAPLGKPLIEILD